ncbi:PAS domain S-box protein [Candidatus Uhrbacteria bacterium]|nr:PAS domain S-box protein [Candidatus Uhrbacteria bacterium]
MITLTHDNRHVAARFKKCIEVAEDTFEATFKLEHPISYLAGQYVWLDLPRLIAPDPKGSRRAFSIINPPKIGQTTIQILFRKSESGFKQTLLALAPESPVTIIGPFGISFQLKKEFQYPLVLLSGGVAMAPFLCIMRTRALSTYAEPIHFYHYDRNKNRTPYEEEIELFNQKGNTASVSTSLFQFSDLSQIHNLAHSLFLISGPQKFIDHAYRILMQHHINPSQCVFEEHYPSIKNADFFKALTKNDDAQKKTLPMTENDIFRTALDSSSSHTMITDIHGTIYYANKAAEKITGFTLDEMIGNTPRLWGGLMPVEFYENFWRMKTGGIPSTTEITNRKKNGEIYYAIVHNSPIFDENQNMIGFIASEEDITEIKYQQNKFEELNEHFILATTSANIATWEWNVLTDTLLNDNLLEELFGIDLKKGEKGVFQTWISILHPDDRDRLVHQVQDAIEQPQKKMDIKFRILRNQETVTIRAIGHIQRNEQREALKMFGICMDITKEDEIDRAKSQFVSLASHQMRTPLTSIKWNAEMLLAGDKGNLGEEQKTTIQEIYASTQRMTLLINALLDVSKIELGTFTVEPQPTNLNSIAQTILQELDPIIKEKHLVIQTMFDETIPLVSVDPKLTMIIFQNLLSNAVKYTPHDGKIECEIRKDEKDFFIRVTDTGIGIPKMQQEHIFKKLFRADNAKEIDVDGTGLGLYLVKSILNHTGGTIRFNSKIGEGSTFVVSIPSEGMAAKIGTQKLIS